MTTLLSRTLANVTSHTDALAFIGNPANWPEIRAVARIPYVGGDDWFQNLMLWLVEHPYNPQKASFSTHIGWGSQAARTKDRRQSESDGTSADQYSCRGSDGSGDDAKGRLLEDGRPTPKIPDLEEDLTIDKILATATETEEAVIFLLVEGHTIRQIAGLLQMGETSVRQRIQYARERAGFKKKVG